MKRRSERETKGVKKDTTHGKKRQEGVKGQRPSQDKGFQTRMQSASGTLLNQYDPCEIKFDTDFSTSCFHYE